MAYLLDANVLIQAKNLHPPRSRPAEHLGHRSGL
jgi:hypothetical protein